MKKKNVFAIWCGIDKIRSWTCKRTLVIQIYCHRNHYTALHSIQLWLFLPFWISSGCLWMSLKHAHASNGMEIISTSLKHITFHVVSFAWNWKLSYISIQIWHWNFRMKNTRQLARLVIWCKHMGVFVELPKWEIGGNRNAIWTELKYVEHHSIQAEINVKHLPMKNSGWWIHIRALNSHRSYFISSKFNEPFDLHSNRTKLNHGHNIMSSSTTRHAQGIIACSFFTML